MATSFIRVPMTGVAPEDYLVSGAASIDLLSAAANFDGSGSGVDFQPAIQVLDESGQVVATALGSVVAAGDSAEVTFAPFLRPPTSTTPPGGSLRVVGTPDTVDPTTEIVFDLPFTVQDDGSGIAEVKLPIANAGFERLAGFSNVTIAAGAAANLTVAHVSGATLLNLTSHSVPTATTKGVYAVSFFCGCTTAMTAGTGYILGLQLNLGLWGTQVLASPVWPIGTGENGGITGVAFLNVGDPITLQIQNFDSVSRDFFIIQGSAQLLRG